MRFWRICRRRYAAEAATGDGARPVKKAAPKKAAKKDAAEAATGDGARLYGGRWNSRGVRVVYASTSLALAAVETFVNLEPNLRPADLVSIQGEIAHALEIAGIDAKMLPAAWHETRDESLRAFGDDWIRGGKSAALLVPSAAIRGEWNMLLNPMHPDYSMIVFRDPMPFEFDMRMFR